MLASTSAVHRGVTRGIGGSGVSGIWWTYSVGSIVIAIERGHAVYASEDCGTALVSVGVEFLFGQNIAACLWRT